MVDPEETIEVPSVGGRARARPAAPAAGEIIEPRVEEIFEHVPPGDLEATGFDDMLASGVVITGGTTLLDGMPEIAEQVFGLPIRRGAPTGVGGLIDVVRSPVVLDRRRPREVRRRKLKSAHLHRRADGASPPRAGSANGSGSGSGKCSRSERFGARRRGRSTGRISRIED